MSVEVSNLSCQQMEVRVITENSLEDVVNHGLALVSFEHHGCGVGSTAENGKAKEKWQLFKVR